MINLQGLTSPYLASLSQIMCCNFSLRKLTVICIGFANSAVHMQNCMHAAGCSGTVAIVFLRGNNSAVVEPFLHVSRRRRWKSGNCSSFNVLGWGDSHMKGVGMLVVSLTGVNFGYSSHLGCSGHSAIIDKL